MSELRFPDDTQRHAIFGMNGTGKTQFGLWALSKRSYTSKPWIIVDYKRDGTIAKIPGLNEIDVARKPPRKAGLYVVRPKPELDDGAIDKMMWRIWDNENTGLMLDEAYMIGRFNKAYRALLTQGRSKHTPIITLSQRPAWISPFVFSESDFLSVFFLPFPSDLKRVQEWIPRADPLALPEFHSLYWDVKQRRLALLSPVPSEAEILNRFDGRRARGPWI